MKAEIRICSLLPSTTEIVCELGLQKNLVGITHECDYPSEILDVQVVTKSLIDHTGSTSSQINTHISEALHKGSGIYAIDNEALSKVDPNIILTQELCEVCAVSYSMVEEVLSVGRTLAQIPETSLQHRSSPHPCHYPRC
mgnify:CR=1 FL=1